MVKNGGRIVYETVILYRHSETYILSGTGGYHSSRRLLPPGQRKVLWHFLKKFTSYKQP